MFRSSAVQCTIYPLNLFDVVVWYLFWHSGTKYRISRFAELLFFNFPISIICMCSMKVIRDAGLELLTDGKHQCCYRTSASSTSEYDK